MADRKLTEGPISRLIVVLSLPILLTFAIQSLYALVNLYFVGWLGGPAVAGLSISLNTFFLVLAVGQSLGSGALALLSQGYGAGDRARMPYVFQQVVWLTLFVGCGMWIAGMLGAEAFVSSFTTDPEVIREGSAFFRVYSATFLLTLMAMVCGNCYRAVGDFYTSTAIFGGGLLINIVLDPLLILGIGPFPKLGLVGAAWASVIAQGVGALAYAWMALGSRRNTLLVVRRPLTLDWGVLWRISKIGAPAGIQYALFSVTLMLTYRYVGPYGAAATAAVGIGFRIIQSAVMACVAIGVAVASLVGQNYGAQRYDRVKSAVRWGLIYTVGLASVEAAVLMLFPGFWVSFFAEQAEIVTIGTLYLVISALMLPPNAFGLIATFMSQGLGRTFAPMVAVFLRVGYFILALQVVDALWGLTLLRIFWIGVTATVADMLAMSVVMAWFWGRALREGVRPAVTPAAVPGAAD